MFGHEVLQRVLVNSVDQITGRPVGDLTVTVRESAPSKGKGVSWTNTIKDVPLSSPDAAFRLNKALGLIKSFKFNSNLTELTLSLSHSGGYENIKLPDPVDVNFLSFFGDDVRILVRKLSNGVVQSSTMVDKSGYDSYIKILQAESNLLDAVFKTGYGVSVAYADWYVVAGGYLVVNIERK